MELRDIISGGEVALLCDGETMVTWNGATTYNVYTQNAGDWIPVHCRTSGRRILCLHGAIEYAKGVLDDLWSDV